MQSARNFVSRAAELAPRVQDRHDHLERVHRPTARILLCRMWTDGDATAVIGDGDLVRLADPYVDAIARAVHSLVDRVVEDLAHEVMQSPQIGRPDVHAGTTAHGLETFEDLDVARAVRAALRCHLGWFFPDGHAHAFPARTRSS